MAFVLAADCSTTACKVIACDDRGELLAEGRASLSLDNPAPDGWEQDAESWWRALGEAVRGLGIDLGAAQAICLTHQRETVVVVDANTRPLAPALVWMDKRCAATVEALAIDREAIHRLGGKPVCTTPSVYKLRWLLDRRPALREGDAALEVHGFLASRLTGRRVTSLASADPMGLVAMEEGRFSEEIAEAVLGPTRFRWPALVAPGARLGPVTPAAARETGLPAGLPVVAGAGDGQCAGLGAGITAPGRAYLNLGTAVVAGVLSPAYRTDRAYRTLYGAVFPQGAPSYFLETDLQGGTFTITWLVERLLGGDEARRADLERRAAALPAGAEGLVLVPYWNGVMNPLWDDRASGVVAGLRGDHAPAHLYRAVLEGIALEQRWHLEAVQAVTEPVAEVVVMGGGSKSDLWCQILADVLERDVVRAGTTEATALGAAILATVACGLHPDAEAAGAAMTRLGARFRPRPAFAAFYRRLFEEVYRGLYEALQTRMQRLSRLRATAPTG